MTRASVALATVVLATLIGGAYAQPNGTPAPDEEANKEAARLAYQDAIAKHEAGDYGAAATSYLAAHDLYPVPLFLYNAAVVFRLGGERAKAVEHYKRYLELEPDGKGSDAARKFIPILENEIADEEAKKLAAIDVKKPGPGEEVPPKKKPVKTVSQTEIEAPLAVAETPEQLARHGRKKRIAGLITVGLGAVGVGVGVGFGLHARSLSAEASDYVGPAGPELDALYRRGDAADRNMIVFVSAGAVTAALGGVVYYLGARDRSRAANELQFFVTPSSAGLAARF